MYTYVHISMAANTCTHTQIYICIHWKSSYRTLTAGAGHVNHARDASDCCSRSKSSEDFFRSVLLPNKVGLCPAIIYMNPTRNKKTAVGRQYHFIHFKHVTQGDPGNSIQIRRAVNDLKASPSKAPQPASAEIEACKSYSCSDTAMSRDCIGRRG